jgi:hypothetical protein
LDLDELGRLEDESGLLPSEGAAKQALQVYARVWPRAQLEVLWADAAHESQRVGLQRVEELGYDVATPPPFYSIVHELPAIPRELGAFHERLNGNGLFPDRHDAEAYLLEYQRAYSRHEMLEDPDGQRVWRVVHTDF